MGSSLPPGPSGTALPFTGRGAYALSQLYYYLSAIVAVGFVIGGTIAAVIALRQLAWPDPGSVTRRSVEALLQGLAFAVPGALSAWWHLGQAKRREGPIPSGVFWGKSLYFHGVAFIAYVVTLGGVVATLVALIDAGFATDCPTMLGGDVFVVCDDAGDSLRAAANGFIVVLVAGAVWWWHLREGRRTVTTVDGGPSL